MFFDMKPVSNPLPIQFPAEIDACCPTLSSAPLSEAEAVELAHLLRSIADPVRLQIVSLILASENGEICSCDVPPAVGKSQPTVSHHLKLLVQSGVVQRQQRGKWAWFALTPGQLSALGRAVGGMACC